MKTSEYPKLILSVFESEPENLAMFLERTAKAFDKHFRDVHHLIDDKERHKAVKKVMKKGSQKLVSLYNGYKLRPALVEQSLKLLIQIKEHNKEKR